MARVEQATGGRPGGRGRGAYWTANLRLIALLLSVWALVSFGCAILGVEWLNGFSAGRLPLGFWFAHQGAIYVFVALVFVYAWCMDRLDRRYQADDGPDGAARPEGPGAAPRGPAR